MTSGITDERIRNVFDLFDADGSGFVEVEELSLALQAVGLGAVPKDTVDRLLADICVEGAIQLDFSDFRRFVRSLCSHRRSLEEASWLFQVMATAPAADVGEDDENPAAARNPHHHNLSSSVASDSLYHLQQQQQQAKYITIEQLLQICREVGELPPNGSASVDEDDDEAEEEKKKKEEYRLLMLKKERRLVKLFRNAIAVLNAADDIPDGTFPGITEGQWLRILQET